jgi:hypothetical protein
MYPVHTFPPYFHKVHLNILLFVNRESKQDSFSFENSFPHPQKRKGTLAVGWK